MKLSILQNEDELNEALFLSNQVFNADSDIDLEIYSPFKKFQWINDPTFNYENIIIAKLNAKIIGIVRLVPREIFVLNRKIKSVGFSSICIGKEYRGLGYSSALMNYALQIAKDRGYELAFLFARRAVDFFYNKFGFWGASSYNTVVIKTPNDIQTNDVSFSLFSSKNIETYNQAYLKSYRNTIGCFSRTPAHWEFIHAKAMTLNINIDAILINDKCSGYCIHKDVEIFEVALIDEEKYLAFIHRFKNKESLKAKIPSTHEMVSNLPGCELQITQRECPWGGHMIKSLQENIDLSYKETLKKFFISAPSQLTEQCQIPLNFSYIDEI